MVVMMIIIVGSVGVGETKKSICKLIFKAIISYHCYMCVLPTTTTDHRANSSSNEGNHLKLSYRFHIQYIPAYTFTFLHYTLHLKDLKALTRENHSVFLMFDLYYTQHTQLLYTITG